LALIGPLWWEARDKSGDRRLDDPADWVRLEISHALKRGITVIPVRIEGTELPKKPALPLDIQGLVDHQAALVTNVGFRNEMNGLARDIHATHGPSGLKRNAVSVAVLALIFGFIALYVFYGRVADPVILSPRPVMPQPVLPPGSPTAKKNSQYSIVVYYQDAKRERDAQAVVGALKANGFQARWEDTDLSTTGLNRPRGTIFIQPTERGSDVDNDVEAIVRSTLSRSSKDPVERVGALQRPMNGDVQIVLW
jgi:hypothetical protein